MIGAKGRFLLSLGSDLLNGFLMLPLSIIRLQAIV